MLGSLTGSGSIDDDRMQGASFGRTIGMRSGNRIACNEVNSALKCRCNVDRKREIIDAQFDSLINRNSELLHQDLIAKRNSRIS